MQIPIKQFHLDRPVLYADLNIFRYVGSGELIVENPELAIWAYSTVHLDEILRGDNRDALNGISVLKAREIISVVDTSSEVWVCTGDVELRDYIDPYIRFNEHIEIIQSSGPDQMEGVIGFINRLFDADNYKELKLSIGSMPESIKQLLQEHDHPRTSEIVEKAQVVANDLQIVIEEHLKDLPKITKRRADLGLPKNISQLSEAEDDPIQYIWNCISDKCPNVDKDHFFGFINPEFETNSPHVYGQSNSFASAHFLLGLLGVSPDKGTKEKRKVLNSLSDANHVGMASFCQFLLTAEKNMPKKAQAVFRHKEVNCTVLYKPYTPSNYLINLTNPDYP